MANYRRIGDVAFVDAVTNEDSVMIEHGGTMRRATLDKIKVSDMTGATTDTAGMSGAVPAPGAGDQDKYLKGDGTWGEVKAGGSSTRQIIVANEDAAAVLITSTTYGSTVYTIPELYEYFSGNKKFTVYIGANERRWAGFTFIPDPEITLYIAMNEGNPTQFAVSFMINASENCVDVNLQYGTNNGCPYPLQYLEIEVFE